MDTEDIRGLGIGDVAGRTGTTERTLRYYEELGLLAPRRDAGGRRRYDAADLDTLYRVRVQRELGTPLADVDPAAGDLLALTTRHLAELDDRLAALTRQRERVRAAEDRLLGGGAPTAEELLGLLVGFAPEDPAVVRSVSLLVYRDVAAAHHWLVETFGLGAGPLHRGDDGVAHLGVLRAGDHEVWLHSEYPAGRLASPVTTDGTTTASLAVHVDDVDAHHARAAAAGAGVDYPPVDQPYGYREYGARDLEGHLWSFQHPLREGAAG
ncbi:MerR family transcriptional regulator [Phycicoccus flavus]|uniref:MerR family transcriptional regulator n=1 Tax=Phycicoccus flavus TaxID=2502783 RepID=UPI00197BCB07|nr:MerR family transcriptional regulator [Phycicoccus flavus]